MGKLHIVMYHYTRDLRHSRYPKIKGLDLELFKEQIQWFTRGGNSFLARLSRFWQASVLD